MNSLEKTVFIEHCTNCKQHGWCTTHKEEKYHEFFSKVKAAILQEFPDFTVFGNSSPPASLKKDNSLNTTKDETSYPRLGSFEITFKNKKIFSKLALGIWPNSMRIVARIKELLQGKEIIDYNHFNPKEIEKSEENQNKTIKIEKHKESSSLPKQTRAKTNNENVKKTREKRETNTEKKPQKTETTPQKQQITAPFIPNNFIQQKPPSKTEIVAYRTEEKGEEKVNFQINTSFNNTKNAEKKAEPKETKNIKKEPSLQEEKHENEGEAYEMEYENEEFESPHEQPIQFYEGDDEKHKEEVIPQEDEYKEDFEKDEGATMQKKPKKAKKKKATSKKNIAPPEEKIQEKVENDDFQRPETQGNHNQNQGKRAKPPAPKEKAEENEDEKYKKLVEKLFQMDYSQDKAASFKILLGEESKKRITISNDDETKANYRIFSSERQGLEVTTPSLTLGPQEKGKIGMVFKPHAAEEQIVYTIFVFKNEEPYEKIVLTANYLAKV